MTKIKSTKSALLASILVLCLCFTMLVGTTFAWFTDSVTSAGNKIVAGSLKIDLELCKDGEYTSIKDSNEPIFNYDKWEPGYTQTAFLKVVNEGNLALKWQAVLKAENELSILADVIDVYVTTADASEEEISIESIKENWSNQGTLRNFIANFEQTKGVLYPSGSEDGASEAYLGIALHMQGEAGNEYQGLELGAFDIQILATQLNAEEDSFGNQYDADAEYPVLDTADKWDGTADTSWYNETDTEFTLASAEQFAGFEKLVNAGNTFEGKTLKLASDVDLEVYDENGELVTFKPIGDKNSGSVFKGTFDGDGHTIENIYQNGWALGYEWGAYGSYGLFGIAENITVKNLNIAGAESLIEGGDVGGVCGSATGTCVFENITITDSDFATYNNGNGGIIGWSGAGNYTFKDITIDETVKLTGLWGSFDSSIGGIVGQGEPGATYNFENVDIACVLNVFNDCTASYDHYNYRMCGMIIGRLEETTTIDGTNYPDTSKYNITCNNVTVTYGEWANYHYCDPTPGLNNGRGMRYESGYSYDGLDVNETYDHSQCTSHCRELIVFDQIFGGAQLGVKGLPAYDGVTVIYNNK